MWTILNGKRLVVYRSIETIRTHVYSVKINALHLVSLSTLQMRDPNVISLNNYSFGIAASVFNSYVSNISKRINPSYALAFVWAQVRESLGWLESISFIWIQLNIFLVVVMVFVIFVVFYLLLRAWFYRTTVIISHLYLAETTIAVLSLLLSAHCPIANPLLFRCLVKLLLHPQLCEQLVYW